MLLFVVSIIALCSTVAVLVNMFLLVSFMNSRGGTYYTATLVLSGFVLVAEVVGGIAGIRYSTKPAKAGVCLGIGAAFLAIGLAMLAVNLANGANPVVSVLGLTLPVLYTIGAVQLKNAA
jgi:hypothetical protein